MADKGFLFFHDWAHPLRQLSGDEFKELFFAMYDFQTKDTPPPKFDGAPGIIADFVFPQLERRKASKETGRAGGQKRWSNTSPIRDGNSTPNRVPNGEMIPLDKDIDKTKQDIDTPPPGVWGERELASLLRSHGYEISRGGTLSFGTVPDLEGLPGIHIEWKRVERLNISEAMRQAVRDSERFCDGSPAVFHRRNREGWLVTMRFEDWMRIYHRSDENHTNRREANSEK